MANKLIDPAPIIKKMAARCLEAKGIECSILGDLIDMLKAAPAENMTPADAVEVVHGRWIEDYETFADDTGYESEPIHTGFVCSVCGRHSVAVEPYCHCGAKMDGDRNA